jgi:hypothetical protein
MNGKEKGLQSEIGSGANPANEDPGRTLSAIVTELLVSSLRKAKRKKWPHEAGPEAAGTATEPLPCLCSRQRHDQPKIYSKSMRRGNSENKESGKERSRNKKARNLRAVKW